MDHNTEPKSILVLGATGYVGGRLIPQLLADGHRVRCLARTPAKLASRPWRSQIEVFEGDLLDPPSLTPAFKGVDVVYYLVHSLGSGEDFEKRERQCAANVSAAAATAGAEQIIYLGGLGDDDDDDLSPHLRSRQMVGRELAYGPTPVVELRAAIILGSGSASFEMLRGLVEVLPIMVTPKWVWRTRCQPIAIDDVLRSLRAVIGRRDLAGIWGIGGPDVVTYAEMMQAYAAVAELRARVVIPVRILSPWLSSHWVDFVTGLPGDLATELVLSLQNDVVVGRRSLADELDLDMLSLRAALREALSAVKDLDVPTRWTPSRNDSPAAPRAWDPEWAGGTVLADERDIVIEAEPAAVMAQVCTLGGDDHWLGYELLWSVRRAGDALVGGVGGRRGRRHPSELAVGDMVDVFRVEQLTETSLVLRAEMKMPGYGWLDWRVEPLAEGPGPRTRLVQRARFVPQGIWGRLYWVGLIPFHRLVFERMLRELKSRAERSPAPA